MNDGISLTDFSLEDFRADLLKFLEKTGCLNAPLGLLPVVPPLNDLFATIMPGVIFCLRQQDAVEDTEAPLPDQPLHPAIWSTSKTTATSAFPSATPSRSSRSSANSAPAKPPPMPNSATFDRQTQDGQDMSYYDALLAKAMEKASTKTTAAASPKASRNPATLSSRTSPSRPPHSSLSPGWSSKTRHTCN